jgi:hypothetical protein
MMLGAVSALVAVRVQRIAANTEIPQVTEPEITATAQPPVQIDPTVDSTAAEVATVTAKPTVTTPKRHEAPADRPRMIEPDRDALNNRAGVQPNEDEQLRQIREAVLYEQWQERRARRVARRERRNRGDRDLSRVDEIFEGTRRSQRP